MKRHFLNFMARRHGFAIRPAIAIFSVAAAMLPVSSQAQSDPDSWELRATMYGWLPSIKAKTQLPTGGDGPTIEIDAKDILDNLNFTFMGALQARKGSWGVFTDALYMDIGSSVTGSREFTVGQMALPAEVKVNANLGLKSWVWTLAGTYRLSESARSSTDLLFGSRMVYMKQTLDWSFSGDIAGLELPARSGSGGVSITNWDAIIGVKGYRFLGADSRWFIPYHVDLGTGDDDFTWQAMAGIGYQFGWGAMVLNYRYLEYEPSSDSPITDISLSGPIIGASFKW